MDKRPKKEQLKTKCKKSILLSLLLLLMFSLFWSAASIIGMVNAQTPYKLTGEIRTSSTNHFWIMNVKANDEISITITPPGDPHYYSSVSFGNLTQIQYDDGLTGYYNDVPYGRHNHDFIAQQDGNYLLSLWTNSRNQFNYTITSDYHALIPQQTSKTEITAIGFSETNLFWINDVAKNDLVLITVTPLSGDPHYYSSVSFKNLTDIQYDDGLTGYYNDVPYGRHNHEFVAAEDGNYRLKIWTNSGNQMNYTITYAHQNPNSVGPQVVTPSTSPAISASVPSMPASSVSIVAPNITGNTQSVVTFSVPASYSGANGNFTYDFGDGQNITTNDKTVTHTYTQPGNYVFTLKLADVPETKVIESYAVTINNASAGGITWDKLVTPIITGVCVLIIGAVLKTAWPRIRRTKKPAETKTQEKGEN